MYDVFSVLKDEHDALKGVMSQLEETSDRAAKKREKLFDQVKSAVIPHMMGEEKVLYPVLLENKATRPSILESIEEHELARYVITELDRMEYTDERWHPKFVVLKENIEHHIKEEEKGWFRDGQKLLSAEARKMLREDYLQEEAIQKASLDRMVMARA